MEKQCDDEKTTTTTSMRLNEVSSDILVDILSRLPEKSLGRFTCVSKEWHSLISSPHPGFVNDLRRQRLRHKSYLYFWKISPRNRFGYQDHSTFLVDTVNERIQDNYHPPMMDTRFFSIISCHNLLCLVGTEISIINLSTQKKAILSHPGHTFPVSFGLGYSSVAEEFKIVRWLADMGNLTCEIFSLTDHLVFKSDSWRSPNETPRPYECLDVLSVSTNGTIFWLIFKLPHPIYLYTNSILAFDLDEEQSKIISCPDLIPDVIPYLVELKDCLCLAHCWEEKAIVKMWRLQDPKNINTSVWVLEYYINFSSICDSIVPLTSVLADHVENLVFLSIKGGGLLYYNVESGTMRKLDNLGNLKPLRCRYEIPCVLKNIEF